MTLHSYQELAKAAGISPVGSQGLIYRIMQNFRGGYTRNRTQYKFLIPVIIGWQFLLFFLFTSDMFNETLFVLLFILSPFLLIFGIFFVTTILVRWLVGEADVQMSAVLLKPGDTLSLHYQQHIKQGANPKSLNLSLILMEHAIYDDGSSRTSVYHDHLMQDKHYEPVPLTPTGMIDETIRFQIPDDAMHSFDTTSNKLVWLLRVKLDLPNFPDYQNSYLLRVLPEINKHES